MHLDYTDPIQLTSGSAHHAFTSCARWQNRVYVAYREAESHWPTPAGLIIVQQQRSDGTWGRNTIISTQDHANCDLRDPRLIATPSALYCLCGGYIPKYPNQRLSRRSSENYMQSFLTYTEDGDTWAPLTPIYRPNYWIWSALPLQDFWVAAAYHTGAVGEASSIHLLFGYSLLALQPLTIMYDGASIQRSGTRLVYPHSLVSEPVLYQPTSHSLACVIRTEDRDQGMEIGFSSPPYQDWRWHNTKQVIHPSALCATPYGLLLAGRELVKRHKTWDAYTALYHLDGHDISHLARLPSAYDTGYAGLCPGRKDDEYLCSYYSQHTTGTMYDTPLPGAHVFVSTLSVTP